MSDAFYGQRYATAIAMFGGAQADICLEDYSGVMENLGLAATGIRDTFQLGHAADPDEITVVVTPKDGEDLDVPNDEAAGWTYPVPEPATEVSGTTAPDTGV